MKLIKYWDIILGFAAGLALTIMAKFDNEKIQLYYSIIILMLASMGVFKIIKQSIDKSNRKEVVDSIVNKPKPVKALNLALNPTQEGEKIGKDIIFIWRESKNIMQKLKELFDKYKGYILAVALGVLTLLEDYGSYINSVFDGKLVLWGYEVIPVVTLVAAVTVGILSNGFSKDEMKTIKALFCKSSDDEIVTEEIKRTIKNSEAELKANNKLLTVLKQELVNLESALTNASNTVLAKQKMYTMVPQLATEADVQDAKNIAVKCEAEVNEKKVEIEKVQNIIKNLSTTISALKSQLK